MSHVSIPSLLGDTNNAYMMMEAFKGSSNIILTDNPQFTKEDFSSIFRIFNIQQEECLYEDAIPIEVFNLFYNMANKSIKYDRFKSQWKYAMCLYIAHYLTLYLQTQSGIPGSKAALASSLPKGIASSKSVDGLSVSYDFMGLSEDFAGYGTWKLTTYGQQLITIAKLYGKGGMWVNF